MPDPFGFNSPVGPPAEADALRDLVSLDRLSRVLAFCGWSLRDLRHNVVARREVAFYLDVDAQIGRRAEVLDLEQQWNPLGRPA